MQATDCLSTVARFEHLYTVNRKALGHLVQVGQVVVSQYKLAKAGQDHQEGHAPQDPVPVHALEDQLLHRTAHDTASGRTVAACFNLTANT